MNQLAYAGRVRYAARHFARTPNIGGLDACNCRASNLRGYRIGTLRGLNATSTRSTVPMRSTVSMRSTVPMRSIPVLLPVSDTKAVAAAVRLFQPSALRGLGSTQQVQGATSLAATGAKVGSIVPGVGTVIGGVVGAVAGWVTNKKPPVRPSPQQMQQCQQLLSEYMGFAAQLPNQPIPMDQEQLRQLNWCLDAVHGAKIQLRDPRWFDPDVSNVFIPIAKEIVRKIYETPVGATVNLGAISFKDPKGRTITFSGYSFTNPVFTDLKTFCETIFGPMMVKMCQETAGKGGSGCEAYYGQTPEFRRWLYDLLGWAAQTTLPNISEEDLRAASVVAQQTGTSAKDVVSAVEQIINKNVARGDTAALLSTTPVTVSPRSTAPPPGPAPGSTPAPFTPLLPTASPGAGSDIGTILSQLLQNQQTPSTSSLAPPSSLLPSGALIPAPVTPSTVDWLRSPYVLGGAALTLLAFVFVLKKKSRRA